MLLRWHAPFSHATESARAKPFFYQNSKSQQYVRRWKSTSNTNTRDKKTQADVYRRMMNSGAVLLQLVLIV